MRPLHRTLCFLLAATAIVTAQAQQPSAKTHLKSCGSVQGGSAAGDYVLVYQSAQSSVCVEKSLWATPASSEAITRFFPYLDAVIVADKALFPIKTPPKPFLFEITKPSGGAHTGCDLDRFSDRRYCDTVTGDAFTNVYTSHAHQKIPGFWGYILTLHESINVFTGLISGGWPSDWWADHRSPFPNAMDIEFTRYIAQSNTALDPDTKSALLTTSKAQEARFTNPANTRDYDPEVVLFLNLFQKYGGFKAFARTFLLAAGEDHLQWGAVSQVLDTGDNNHSELLSEYVIAYLHLGLDASQDLTPLFRDAGVGTFDTKIAPYTVDSAKVKAIADAHCSIRAAINAGVKINKELSDLQQGNFARANAEGGSTSTCPTECTFTSNRCQAKF